MKRSSVAIALLTLLVVSSGVRADTDNTSGAPDATVMTQTHDSKAAGNKHGDATNGGRPTTQSSTTKAP